jgi:hypothetical protein
MTMKASPRPGCLRLGLSGPRIRPATAIVLARASIRSRGRIGEVSGICRADIDCRAWTWTVRRQTTLSPGGLVDKGTEDKRARAVPLIEKVRPLVDIRLNAIPDDPMARLLTGPRGSRITTADLAGGHDPQFADGGVAGAGDHVGDVLGGEDLGLLVEGSIISVQTSGLLCEPSSDATPPGSATPTRPAIELMLTMSATRRGPSSAACSRWGRAARVV